MIVDRLPGTILATGGFAGFPPPAKAAVQVPSVHVRQDHPEAILEEIRSLWPGATTPRLNHVDLRIEVHADVGSLGQRRAPQDHSLRRLIVVGLDEPLHDLRLEFRPHRVMIGHVLRLHRGRDVPVLGPTVQVHLVAAQVHDVTDLG